MTNRIRGRRPRRRIALAAMAAAFGLTFAAAVPAHAGQGVALKPLTCAHGWVNVKSTSSGDVWHKVVSPGITSNFHLGWSPVLTPWHSAHWFQTQVQQGSQVYATQQVLVHSVQRYCG